MKLISNYSSPNFNKRKAHTAIQFIIIHYTAMKTDIEAINYLCDVKSRVSSHFLINKKGRIYSLVSVKKRAWHAGASHWQKYTDINSRSIGIELDYHPVKANKSYSVKQISALIYLLKQLKKKFKINSNCILGHSDIAPYRKIDPGKNFPWRILSKRNITYFPVINLKSNLSKIDNNLNILNFKTKKQKILYILDSIGYDISLAKINYYNYKKLIMAYQMHFVNTSNLGKINLHTYNSLLFHYNQLLTK